MPNQTEFPKFVNDRFYYHFDKKAIKIQFFTRILLMFKKPIIVTDEYTGNTSVWKILNKKNYLLSDNCIKKQTK